MSTRQSFNNYDCSTYANFKTWASDIGVALSSFGWVLVDTTPSTCMTTSKWGTATVVPTIVAMIRPSVVNQRGNFATGTSGYVGTRADNTTAPGDNVATDAVVDSTDGLGSLNY